MATRHPNYRLAKIHRNYTVEEVARLFGVHRNTVREWIKRGLPTSDDKRPKLILGRDLIAFLQAEPCGQTPGHAVPDDDLQRNDIHALRQQLPVTHPLDEVGWDPACLNQLKQTRRDPVIHDTFVRDGPAFLCIERRRIILEQVYDVVRPVRREHLVLPRKHWEELRANEPGPACHEDLHSGRSKSRSVL